MKRYCNLVKVSEYLVRNYGSLFICLSNSENNGALVYTKFLLLMKI